MNSLLKNKIALLGVLAVIIMAIGVGIIFAQNNNGSADEVAEEQIVDEQAIEMTPEEIGLILEPNSDNTEIEMKIEDVSKFDSFEYEMNYDAEVDGEMVPRGAIGSGEVSGSQAITRSITVGTCSSGKCKYDAGVTKVSFLIRLNLKDGTTGVVKQDLDLSE